ncbi:hypothetical protein KAR91_47855 [Candidatus Pacearchaeota archaeon]|nr:hypothetical protein [Candidatus Pacearchaeota archaeon]
MKFLTIKLGDNNSVGVNMSPEGTYLMFEAPNENPKETKPKMVDVKVTEDSIKTFIKISPKATNALQMLLNQEITDEGDE